MYKKVFDFFDLNSDEKHKCENVWNVVFIFYSIISFLINQHNIITFLSFVNSFKHFHIKIIKNFFIYNMKVGKYILYTANMKTVGKLTTRYNINYRFN